ncbi:MULTISPECIES: hypothetical protein [unclassified Solwaraspora]|uniref:hypothetical protein n=1 Tax=unclassified Solwaraspora TaxID=2627926 RepID=UPI00259B175E|nr:hypothetical protein [Solwaraspora sp. WMMA2056]WJK38189.1 hypothetical protein O7608_16865 [Solwaraspora sp. WMMA2056]
MSRTSRVSGRLASAPLVVALAVAAALVATAAVLTVHHSASAPAAPPGPPDIAQAFEALVVRQPDTAEVLYPQGGPQLRHVMTAAGALQRRGQLHPGLLARVRGLTTADWAAYLDRYPSVASDESADYPAYFAIWQWDRLNRDLAAAGHEPLPTPPPVAARVAALARSPQLTGVHRLWAMRLGHLAGDRTLAPPRGSCAELAARLADPVRLGEDTTFGWLPATPARPLCQGDPGLVTGAADTAVGSYLGAIRSRGEIGGGDLRTLALLVEVATVADAGHRPPGDLTALHRRAVETLQQQADAGALRLDPDDLAFFDLLHPAPPRYPPALLRRVQMALLTVGRVPYAVDSAGLTTVLAPATGALLGVDLSVTPRPAPSDGLAVDAVIEALGLRTPGAVPQLSARLLDDVTFDGLHHAAVTMHAYAVTGDCARAQRRAEHLRELTGGVVDDLADGVGIDYAALLHVAAAACQVPTGLPQPDQLIDAARRGIATGRATEVWRGAEVVCLLDDAAGTAPSTDPVRRRLAAVAESALAGYASGAAWSVPEYGLIDLYAGLRLRQIAATGCAGAWWDGVRGAAT